MFCSLKFASDNCGEVACAAEGSKASPMPGSQPQVGLNTEERMRATSQLTSSHLPQGPSCFSFLLTWSLERMCPIGVSGFSWSFITLDMVLPAFLCLGIPQGYF